MPSTVCVIAVAKLSGQLGEAQMAWNAKIQKRIASTTSILQNIKSVHMLGLVGAANKVITQHRTAELASSEIFRNRLIWQTMIGTPQP
jgi:ATP-binding cassette, subfamily C (CFTR/MRP), member 1